MDHIIEALRERARIKHEQRISAVVTSEPRKPLSFTTFPKPRELIKPNERVEAAIEAVPRVRNRNQYQDGYYTHGTIRRPRPRRPRGQTFKPHNLRDGKWFAVCDKATGTRLFAVRGSYLHAQREAHRYRVFTGSTGEFSFAMDHIVGQSNSYFTPGHRV